MRFLLNPIYTAFLTVLVPVFITVPVKACNVKRLLEAETKLSAATIFPDRGKISFPDPFTHSDTLPNGKVFLYPWNLMETTGNWFYNAGYCRKFGAEMVTINSLEEYIFFKKFMKFVGMIYSDTDHPSVWLGAKVVNQTQFTLWENGEPFHYDNMPPEAVGYGTKVDGVDGIACLYTTVLTYNNKWFQQEYCTKRYLSGYVIACQKYTWSLS